MPLCQLIDKSAEMISYLNRVFMSIIQYQLKALIFGKWKSLARPTTSKLQGKYVKKIQQKILHMLMAKIGHTLKTSCQPDTKSEMNQPNFEILGV